MPGRLKISPFSFGVVVGDLIGRREGLDLRFAEARAARVAQRAEGNAQPVAVAADFLIDLEAALQLRLIVGSEDPRKAPALARRLRLRLRAALFGCGRFAGGRRGSRGRGSLGGGRGFRRRRRRCGGSRGRWSGGSRSGRGRSGGSGGRGSGGSRLGREPERAGAAGARTPRRERSAAGAAAVGAGAAAAGAAGAGAAAGAGVAAAGAASSAREPRRAPPPAPTPRPRRRFL